MAKIPEPTALSKPKILPDAYFFCCTLRLKFLPYPTSLLQPEVRFLPKLTSLSCPDVRFLSELTSQSWPMSDSCLKPICLSWPMSDSCLKLISSSWPMSDSCQVAPQKALHNSLLLNQQTRLSCD